MPNDSLTTRITIAKMLEGGSQVVLPDSGSGQVWRPNAQATPGGRVATPETLFDYWIDNVPDPRWAYRINPNIYNHLRTHPDVVAARRKREYTVASYPWRFNPNPVGEDKASAALAAEYCTWVFSQITAKHQIFREMQEAVIDGSRAHEWQWHQEATGFQRPFMATPVDRTRFLFDRMGNMAIRTRFQPVWGSYVMSDPRVPVPESAFPRGKFTYHVHMRMPGTWDDTGLEGYVYYGLGEDVALAYVLTYDTFVLRFRMKWLEKFAMPPTDIYYPDSMQQFVPQMKKIATAVRGESSTQIPRPAGEKYDDYFHIEQREVPSPSMDAMADFSENWTKPRIDAILLGEVTPPKKKQGGYSNKVQEQDAGPQVWFQWDSTNISATLTDQLIPAIMMFGPEQIRRMASSYYPIFSLQAAEQRDRAQEIGIVKQTATMVKLSVDEIYEKTGFRKPGPNDETVGGFIDPAVAANTGDTSNSDINQGLGKAPNASGEVTPNHGQTLNNPIASDNNPNHQQQNPANSPKLFPKVREPQGHSPNAGGTIVGGRKPEHLDNPRNVG
jgi:hypothetical protein